LLKQVYNRKDLAEELTQETFYQAFLSLHRYRGNCDISLIKTGVTTAKPTTKMKYVEVLVIIFIKIREQCNTKKAD